MGEGEKEYAAVIYDTIMFAGARHTITQCITCGDPFIVGLCVHRPRTIEEIAAAIRARGK
jgi:hypothetical protein